MSEEFRKKFIDRMYDSITLRDKMNVQKRFYGKKISDLKEMKSLVQQVMESFEKDESIILCGTQGSGKSHIASALMYEWLAKNVKFDDSGTPDLSRVPYFLPMSDLYLELKSSFDNEMVAEKDILEKYWKKPLLVLDDLGVEKLSDWSRNVVYSLIGKRYNECLQTVVTTNLQLDEIGKLIDSRISDRLEEMGVTIKTPQRSWRKKIRSERSAESARSL